MNDLRILHIHHALYLPVVYVRELRNRGFKADVIYFNTEQSKWICGIPDYNLGPLSFAIPKNLMKLAAFLVRHIDDYDVFHFHSQPGFIPFNQTGMVFRLFGMPDLQLLRIKGKRIIFSHWGCMDGRLPSTFALENDGKICQNCKTGNFGSMCSDKLTRAIGETQEHFGQIINHEPDFKDFNAQAVYHPAIFDFDLFSPEIEIPEKFKLHKDPERLYIYHSIGLGKNRSNESGTQVIVATIDQMKRDGLKIELITVDGRVPYWEVRYYQHQADLSVDNLYYGWYGNMVRECMGQAVPCATRINPEWARINERLFGEAPPIIDVCEETLRDTLAYYCDHRDELRQAGIRQREYLHRVHGTDRVVDMLISLYRGERKFTNPES